MILTVGYIMLGCAAFCAVLSFILLILSKKRADKNHIAKGKRVYSDLAEKGKPLFSPRLQLSGCPDYIVQSKKQVIPVEVKSCSSHHPYNSHVFQLACYCQLVEESYQRFVSKGILIYENDQFHIPFDPKLRFELEKTIQEMRQLLQSNKQPSITHDLHLCANCSLQKYCSLFQKN